MTLLTSIKTIFFLITFLYIAPFLFEGIKKQYIALLEPRTPIGILHVLNPFNQTSYFIERLHFFFKNPSIKGIIIKIDCTDIAPGTSHTIFHDIRQLKKMYPKPIIALIENTCLAGAYLIASVCDYIIAPESAIIGNIGYTFTTIPHYILDEEHNEMFNDIKNELYQHLTKQIALQRKLLLTTTHSWGDGKIFTGSKAVSLGLSNEVGSLCAAIRTIKEKALIEGEIEWIEYNDKTSYSDIFLGNKSTIL
ncbi:MAG TPA: S49 family peptidase [Candidatus Babeliales bacterium]|nr:S49 family peptidase [Candidatus Babeliales bacterium]